MASWPVSKDCGTGFLIWLLITLQCFFLHRNRDVALWTVPRVLDLICLRTLGGSYQSTVMVALKFSPLCHAIPHALLLTRSKHFVVILLHFYEKVHEKYYLSCIRGQGELSFSHKITINHVLCHQNQLNYLSWSNEPIKNYLTTLGIL